MSDKNWWDEVEESNQNRGPGLASILIAQWLEAEAKKKEAARIEAEKMREVRQEETTPPPAPPRIQGGGNDESLTV